MWYGHALKTALLLAATGLATGCSQIGSTFPRRTSMGTLKTSLSHLEFENEQLRKEVAQLRTDSREIEDRLVQEESDNGDLKARLDDARNLLSQKGVDLGGESSSAMNRRPDPVDAPTTLPAGQSSRKRRKAPFTQIPGRIEMVPPSDPADSDEFVVPKSSPRNEFGPESRRGDTEVWLPIAHGTSAPSVGSKVR